MLESVDLDVTVFTLCSRIALFMHFVGCHSDSLGSMGYKMSNK